MLSAWGRKIRRTNGSDSSAFRMIVTASAISNGFANGRIIKNKPAPKTKGDTAIPALPTISPQRRASASARPKHNTVDAVATITDRTAAHQTDTGKSGMPQTPWDTTKIIGIPRNVDIKISVRPSKNAAPSPNLNVVRCRSNPRANGSFADIDTVTIAASPASPN